jgi:antitoxin MazE
MASLRAYAEEPDLSEGTTVEVKRSGRKLVLMSTQQQYELSELVSGITPKNRHEETNWGKPTSKGTW